MRRGSASSRRGCRAASRQAATELTSHADNEHGPAIPEAVAMQSAPRVVATSRSPEIRSSLSELGLLFSLR
jgi:hypothetical protein